MNVNILWIYQIVQYFKVGKSIVFFLYLSIASSLMKLSHFNHAYDILMEAKKLTEKSSLLNYRLAQTYAFNKYSTTEKLQEAISLIDQAIEIKKTEIIFQTPGRGVMKQLNLDNADEAFIELRVYLNNKIKR